MVEGQPVVLAINGQTGFKRLLHAACAQAANALGNAYNGD